ncbi:MAG TPA: hypothetical protein VJP03_06160 [Actinomycetota bacterium]|nr:hypothetical protein [Actinomycetota bacterium]
MADTQGSRGEGDLPDLRGEPEPDWVEGIRRGREERAERLRSLLGQARPADAPEREPPPVEDQPASAGEPVPPAGAPEPPA